MRFLYWLLINLCYLCRKTDYREAKIKDAEETFCGGDNLNTPRWETCSTSAKSFQIQQFPQECKVKGYSEQFAFLGEAPLDSSRYQKSTGSFFYSSQKPSSALTLPGDPLPPLKHFSDLQLQVSMTRKQWNLNKSCLCRAVAQSNLISTSCSSPTP